MTTRYDATQKLIAIYESGTQGSNTRLTAIAALGRAGGHDALEKLVEIYDKANAGSATRLAVIQALGELGRLN